MKVSELIQWLGDTYHPDAEVTDAVVAKVKEKVAEVPGGKREVCGWCGGFKDRAPFVRKDLGVLCNGDHVRAEVKA